MVDGESNRLSCTQHHLYITTLHLPLPTNASEVSRSGYSIYCEFCTYWWLHLSQYQIIRYTVHQRAIDAIYRWYFVRSGVNEHRKLGQAILDHVILIGSTIGQTWTCCEAIVVRPDKRATRFIREYNRERWCHARVCPSGAKVMPGHLGSLDGIVGLWHWRGCFYLKYFW